MDPLVSIVIPCYNEELYIYDCISSLLNGEYKNIEIIVVDGASTDRTIEILENLKQSFNNIRVLSNPHRITPVSMNIGINAARGSFIMIAGAHSTYPYNYISELLKYQRTLDCDVIGGAIETKVKNENPKSRAIATVLSDKFGVGNSSFRTKSNGVFKVDTVPFGIYKRVIFDKVGFFNELLIRNQDFELSKRIVRAGFKIFLVSHIRCVYYARENYSKLARNSFDYGYWNILTIYITKKLTSLAIRHYVPLFFIISIIMPLFLSFLTKTSLYFISLFILSIYSFFLLSLSLRFSFENKKSFFYLIFAYITLHFSYGFGSLCALTRFDKIKR